MKGSNTISLCREKLGLSQPALADYLQVSRSLLNMAERGERELPTPAFFRLTQLMRFYDAASPAEVPPERTQEAKQKNLKTFQRLAKEAAWQLAKLNRELATMEANYVHMLNRMKVFQQIRQHLMTHPNEPDRERNLLWLDIRQEEVWQQLEKNSPEAQRSLRFKIITSQASLQAAQQMVDELESSFT